MCVRLCVYVCVYVYVIVFAIDGRKFPIVKSRPLVRPAHLFDSNKFQVSNPVAANCWETRTHLPAYFGYCLKGAREKKEMGRWGGREGERRRESLRAKALEMEGLF